MKRVFLIVLICFIGILGVVVYRYFDSDGPRKLSDAQKILGVEAPKPSEIQLDHIAIITMENKSYDDIVKNSNAPFLNSLIQNYSFADQYFAVDHPSLPNYIALIGGDTFGIHSDCTDCFITSSNLVDQLEQAHKSWKAYLESMPNPCFLGSVYPYAQKHNPFVYFDDIRTNASRCNRIVPFSELTKDLKDDKSTPNFIWISPNLCSDMHDCPVTTGDNWLATHVPEILTSPAFTGQKSILIVTWDEGEGAGNNQVPLILAGNAVKQQFVIHTKYSHYSLLHTIESVWNIPPLTLNVLQAPVFSDIFKKQ